MPTVPQLPDLLLRWEELRDQGQNATPEELCRDCPEHLDELRRRIAALQAMDQRLHLTADESVERSLPLSAPNDHGRPSEFLDVWKQAQANGRPLSQTAVCPVRPDSISSLEPCIVQMDRCEGVAQPRVDPSDGATADLVRGSSETQSTGPVSNPVSPSHLASTRRTP